MFLDVQPHRPRPGPLPPRDQGGAWKPALLAAVVLHLAALWIVFPSRELGFVEEQPTGLPVIRIHVPPARAPEAPDRARRALSEVPSLSLPGNRVPVESLEPVRSVEDTGEGILLQAERGAQRYLLGSPRPGLAGAATLVEDLERIRFVEPVYPSSARRQGIEGTVILDLLIDDEGRVDRIAVVEEVEGGLTESALRAVRQWRYRPYRVSGEATEARMIVRIRFRLRG